MAGVQTPDLSARKPER